MSGDNDQAQNATPTAYSVPAPLVERILKLEGEVSELQADKLKKDELLASHGIRETE